MKFFNILIFTLILCGNVQAQESDFISKLRETVQKSFIFVESKFSKVEVIVPTPKPEPDEKCKCDGKGYIIHGDGHKTPCTCGPNCKCKTKNGKSGPSASIPKRNAEIIMYSSTTCGPCQQMKRDVIPLLQDKKLGWKVKIISNDNTPANEYSKILEENNVTGLPTFDIWVNGTKHRTVGGQSKEMFFAELKQILESEKNK